MESEENGVRPFKRLWYYGIFMEPMLAAGWERICAACVCGVRLCLSEEEKIR